MRCLFLYNPNSGKGKVAKKIGYIRRKLEEHFDEVNIAETSSGEDLERRAAQGAEEYDVILFSGGDGTFNNVLQGVGERDVKLGYIPSGTVNDVAHSLGIPCKIKRALKLVFEGHTQKVDCMRVNGTHYAMYVAAAGAFTSATYTTPQSKKKKFGRVAYAVQGLKKNMNFEVFPLHLECGGKSLETHGVLVLVMNGRRVAGFPVNKKASMRDGTLEVAVIKQVKKPNAFQRFRKYFSLAALMVFGARVKRKDIEFMSGEELTVRTNRDLVWDFDGEEGICGDVHIEVLRDRVNLFTPKNKKI